MNDYKVEIEPIHNGIRADVKIPKQVIRNVCNLLLDKVHEINRLILNDKYELQIRELLNRIDKASKLIDELILIGTYEYEVEEHLDLLKEILGGKE